MSLPYVLAPADYRRMPWKNGGGHTWEIAADPPGSDLASFAWRVSVAAVERDGPFSPFPGVERTLVLLAGHGMRLSGTGAPVELQAPFEPVTFAGEAAIDCALVDGPTRDFNLMVRRSCASAQLLVVRDRGEPMPRASTYVCYAASGACECVLAGFPPFEVAPEHTLVVDAALAPGAMRVNPVSDGSIALVAAIERKAA
jgi:environmental stress-induced protein Ves